MGNTIPMVMVTSADLSSPIKGFSYKQLGDARKAARELKKELKEMNVVGAEPNSKTSSDESSASTLLADQQTWTNSAGKTITAAVLMADDSTVTFLMPNGKSVAYPMAQLSEASVETIMSLIE